MEDKIMDKDAKRKYDKTKAHQIYSLADGTIVDGVTTIIGNNLGWNKGALIGWARKEALAGRDPNKVLVEAGDIGSLVHFLVDCHLAKEEPDLSDFSSNQIDVGLHCFNKFLLWKSEHDLTVMDVERPLVAEIYGYGGTRDIKCLLDGRVTILDWKSSVGVYDEHWIQAAALLRLDYENRDEMYDWDWRTLATWPDFKILHISKTEGKEFEVMPKSSKELLKYWCVFEHLLEIHKLKKEINPPKQRRE